MKKTITTSDIIAQKLEHINYFRQDDINDSLYISIARDACYTANNSIQFKRKMISDTLAEYDQAVDDNNTYAKERAERWAARLKAELEILEERFEIEKAVYFSITGGEEWTTKPSANNIRKPSINMEDLRNKVRA